jgi:hypothetical protein
LFVFLFSKEGHFSQVRVQQSAFFQWALVPLVVTQQVAQVLVLFRDCATIEMDLEETGPQTFLKLETH